MLPGSRPEAAVRLCVKVDFRSRRKSVVPRLLNRPQVSALLWPGGGGSATASVSFPQDGGRGGPGCGEDGSQPGLAPDPAATGICKSLWASSFCTPQILPAVLRRMWGFSPYGGFGEGESYGLMWKPPNKKLVITHIPAGQVYGI